VIVPPIGTAEVPAQRHRGAADRDAEAVRVSANASTAANYHQSAPQTDRQRPRPTGGTGTEAAIVVAYAIVENGTTAAPVIGTALGARLIERA
jgi:hypothetical protein